MSTVKFDTWKNGNGTRTYAPIVAWVNYNGTTNTIRDSENISSVTDNGTGDFTFNFTTAFANTNYIHAVGLATDTASQFPRGAVYNDGDTKSTTANSLTVETTGGSTKVDINQNLICWLGGI